MIVDIDDFKYINDTYGHTMGDEVLQAFAKTLPKNARASDLIARYGGDEFIILLTKAEISHAVTIGEKIIKEINQQPVTQNIHVTVSIGLASYLTGSAEDLINEADKGLYRAKENGKNQLAK